MIGVVVHQGVVGISGHGERLVGEAVERLVGEEVVVALEENGDVIFDQSWWIGKASWDGGVRTHRRRGCFCLPIRRGRRSSTPPRVVPRMWCSKTNLYLALLDSRVFLSQAYWSSPMETSQRVRLARSRWPRRLSTGTFECQ